MADARTIESTEKIQRIQLKQNRVGFVIKHNQPEADALALSLARHALDNGVNVAFADESKRLPKALAKTASSSEPEKRRSG